MKLDNGSHLSLIPN